MPASHPHRNISMRQSERRDPTNNEQSSFSLTSSQHITEHRAWCGRQDVPKLLAIISPFLHQSSVSHPTPLTLFLSLSPTIKAIARAIIANYIQDAKFACCVCLFHSPAYDLTSPSEHEQLNQLSNLLILARFESTRALCALCCLPVYVVSERVCEFVQDLFNTRRLSKLMIGGGEFAANAHLHEFRIYELLYLETSLGRSLYSKSIALSNL